MKLWNMKIHAFNACTHLPKRNRFLRWSTHGHTKCASTNKDRLCPADIKETHPLLSHGIIAYDSGSYSSMFGILFHILKFHSVTILSIPYLIFVHVLLTTTFRADTQGRVPEYSSTQMQTASSQQHLLTRGEGCRDNWRKVSVASPLPISEDHQHL